MMGTDIVSLCLEQMIGVMNASILYHFGSCYLKFNMFKKEYQGGPYVEVFSAQGRDPASKWKLSGSVKKEFDKLVRGYVYCLDGGVSTTTTRMQLPKSDKNSLSLVQPCCVFQLLMPQQPAKLSLDLTILDDTASRRRIHLSSSLRELNVTPLNAQIPLGGVIPGQWVNLCVDIGALVQTLFKAHFRSLEAVSIGGSCRLRRLFTLLNVPTSSEDGTNIEIPRLFHIGSVNVQTHVVSPRNWEDSKLIHGVSESSSNNLRPTHVAFGKKVAIPDHILSSRQSTRQADTRAKGGVGRVQPHPPPSPLDPSMLRVQKTRVHMISGKSSKLKGSVVASIHDTLDGDVDTNASGDVSPRGAVSRSSLSKSPVPENEESVLSEDEKLALQILQEDKKRLSCGTAGSAHHDSSDLVYSYRSAPKSTERHSSSVQFSEENTSRSGRLEEDFLSPHDVSVSSDNQIIERRLSDDYDWRQYASTDKDIPHSPEESLRTRLASRSAHSPLDVVHDSEVVSESMTLSGCTEQFKNATFMDTLDTREMGGLLSPALLDTMPEECDMPRPDALELMYDPQLNCFYDPLTCKYYELIHTE